VDIVITKNGFWTLMDVVIVDSTRTNMVQRTLTTTHAKMMAVQEKTQSYVERTLNDTFTPLLLRCMGVFIFVLIHF
jgi:hypothetical protein